VKYNIFVFKTYALFFGNSPTGQTNRRILPFDDSYDTESWKDVHFGGFDNTAVYLRGQIPLKSLFRGSYRRFQAKLVKNLNLRILETTPSIAAKFCTVIKITK